MQSRNKREGTYAGKYQGAHYRTDIRARTGKYRHGPRTAKAKLQSIGRGNRRLEGRKPVHPKPMTLDSNTVMEAVKRVMDTHLDVIKALGNR